MRGCRSWLPRSPTASSPDESSGRRGAPGGLRALPARAGAAAVSLVRSRASRAGKPLPACDGASNGWASPTERASPLRPVRGAGSRPRPQRWWWSASSAAAGSPAATTQAHRPSAGSAAPRCARRLPPRDGAQFPEKADLAGRRGGPATFPCNRFRAPASDLFSTWKTTLAGTPAAGLAYRWRGIVVVQYAFPAELIRQQPGFGRALPRCRRSTKARTLGQGVIALLEGGSGTLLIADVPPEELRRLIL